MCVHYLLISILHTQNYMYCIVYHKIIIVRAIDLTTAAQCNVLMRCVELVHRSLLSTKITLWVGVLEYLVCIYVCKI